MRHLDHVSKTKRSDLCARPHAVSDQLQPPVASRADLESELGEYVAIAWDADAKLRKLLGLIRDPDAPAEERHGSPWADLCVATEQHNFTWALKSAARAVRELIDLEAGRCPFQHPTPR